MIKLSENEEPFNIQKFFPIFYPKLIDDINEQILSPLSCISELESKWLLEFDLPLVNKNDISVSIDNGNIISVEAKLREAYIDENLEQNCEFHFFKKRVSLPGKIDDKKITSAFKNGRLTILIPKKFSGNKINIE